MTRRLPRLGEIREVIGRPDQERSRQQRRLDRCASVLDVRDLARRRVPRAVFDYTDGAAMSEASLRRARSAFRQVEFTPRVMRDVSKVELTTDILGEVSALPFAFAPTGFTRMMHHAGESAVAGVAGRSGIPYSLSTLGTTSIEALAEAAPNTRRWFQLYVSRDRQQAEDLMARAAARGYDTLVLTVDTAVGGIRYREVRNGLTIPPALTAGALAGMAMHPRWWFNALTTEPLRFASLESTDGTVGDLLTRVLDPGITGADIAWIRSHWQGRILIKGIQSVEDAVMAADLGVDAIVLSNHGGRQVDRGTVPLELLPMVVSKVGDQIQVGIDGGILSGTDIVASLAFGADFVLVGRAYLYGLMAGGTDGVQRVVDILTKEVRTTMQLIGARSVSEVRQAQVRLRAN
jgi:L-lactate dehydrogenase (cytochrome)